MKAEVKSQKAEVRSQSKISILLFVCFVCFVGISLAAFTSPPWDGSPAMNNDRMWQAYSSLVERCNAACAAYPTSPAPAMTHIRLTQYKTTLKGLLDNQWWIDPDTPIGPTNRLTSAGLLAKFSLPTNWYDKTDITGISQATNGLLYWTNLMSKVVWTAVTGAPVFACNSSTGLALVDAGGSASCPYFEGCGVASNEAKIAWTNDFPAVWPIGAERDWTVLHTNTVYEYIYNVTRWEGDGAFCDATNHVDPPAGYTNTYVQTFSNYYSCTYPTTFYVWCESGETPLHSRWDPVVTNTYDPCHAFVQFACGPQFRLDAFRVVAPVWFAVCSTNYSPATQEQWYLGAFACTNTTNWTLEAGIPAGLVQGWTSVVVTAGTTGDVCNTDWTAPTNIPWQGETDTNGKGWGVSGAFMVQKWGFAY